MTGGEVLIWFAALGITAGGVLLGLEWARRR